jgi:DNA-binding NarL/FixJ family response regulator
MGIGLTDQDISTAMQLSLQSVRNHIESLLNANELSNRTQLAVLRAIDWSIPDFA